MKNAIKAVAFLAVGVVLFLGVQWVLTPQWRYPRFGDDMPDTLKEYQVLSKDTALQALFVGVSCAELAIDPMMIYEQEGIVTFNLATASQPLPVTEFILKEAFKTQHPKVVFLEASSLFYSEDSFYAASYHYVVDNMPFNSDIIDLAEEYASHYPEEEHNQMMLDLLLPLYAYHSRWAELEALDFTLPWNMNFYRKGVYLSSGINPATITADWMNEFTEVNYRNSGVSYAYIDGERHLFQDRSKLYSIKIRKKNREWLLRIKNLCEANGAELRVIKVPLLIGENVFSVWPLIRSKEVRKLCQQLDIEYDDLMYDDSVSIDWMTDSGDMGWHLNYLGAKKVSTFFSDVLVESCGLTPIKAPRYDEDIPIHRAVCDLAELQTIQYFEDYLEALSKLEDATVFFSAKDDIITSLTPEMIDALKAFGLKTEFSTLSYSDSFLAVVENGRVVYEASSNRKLTHEGVLNSGLPYAVLSNGWLTIDDSQIRIDGVEYSPNRRGFNIVVLDNASGLVLDCVCFDTYIAGNPTAERDPAVTEQNLRRYEEYFMRQDYKRGIR